jgi:predicted dinucleotide-binding enzyme
MKIGVLGTGMVGGTIATKLVQIGHQVMMGSRNATTSEAAQEWLKSVGGSAQIGTFTDAAAFGEIVFDCTNGANSLAALRLAGAKNLRGKVLIHVGNPLDFSKGMPMLTVCNADSLGEQVQREFPEALVVKALNTVNCELMVNPSIVPGDHNLFICGNDAAAKAKVTAWLNEWFGWVRTNVVDLGDITGARGMEMWMPLWLRLYGSIGHPHFNLRLMIGGK